MTPTNTIRLTEELHEFNRANVSSPKDSGLNLGKRENKEKPERTPDAARLGRLLRQATALQAELADTANAFFAARPFRMIAEPSATDPGRDVYSFRMDKPIPWKIRWLAKRLLRLLRRIADRLPERRVDGALEKVRRYDARFLHPALVPGARATTELQLDGKSLPRAAISAPTWSPETREISVVGQDPEGGLKGRVEVRFQLELSGQDHQAPRQSVIALTGAAIWEAEQLLERTGAAHKRPEPVQAGRHHDHVRDEDSA
jgi:hypothetical protein